MSTRRTYGTLDGMRGVAAIAVVVLHAPSLMGVVKAPSGGLAVDLFFVMSGFIIAHAYEKKIGNSLTASRFIIVRLARLYPLYLLGLTLGVLQAFASIGFGSSEAWSPQRLLAGSIAGLFMVPTLGSGPVFPLNPPAWSLFFELVVNIAYVLALPWLGNRVLAAVVGIAAITLVALGLQFGDLHFGSHAPNFVGGFARVAYSFPIGILIYRLAPHGIGVKLHPLLIMGIAAAIFAQPLGTFTLGFEIFAVLVALPLLTLLSASVEPSPRLAPSFAFLGLVSYGIYSLHYPLVLLMQAIVKRLPIDATPWIGLFFIACLVPACWLIDRWFDQPLRRLMVARLGSARAGKSSQPPADGAAPEKTPLLEVQRAGDLD